MYWPYPAFRRRPGRSSAAGRGGPPGPARLPNPRAFSAIAVRSPRQCPGRITRSIPSGTSRCRATHLGVISAATEIGNTATSAVKPARGASSSSMCRSANSASRPVTKRYRGRSGAVVVIHAWPL